MIGPKYTTVHFEAEISVPESEVDFYEVNGGYERDEALIQAVQDAVGSVGAVVTHILEDEQ